MRSAWLAIAAAVWLAAACPALADDTATARDIQAAVDAYLASAAPGSAPDARLVGGPGAAGYDDDGFWLRGGESWLRINLTLQARYEWFDFPKSEEGVPIGPGSNVLTHDLSGFSLPRATIKLSGSAPCRLRYYAELELGHPGGTNAPPSQPIRLTDVLVLPWPVQAQPNAFDELREAWVQWDFDRKLNVRMGLVKTPATRQLMVPPELQQFADVSMASAVTGLLMPGYTDRNRDYGVLVHGSFGGAHPLSYGFAVANGDGGDGRRSVLDYGTSDNLAFSGRLNWAFLDPIGYEEGGFSQRRCTWYGEIGAWAYYYADREDRSAVFAGAHGSIYDRLMLGADAAFGYGGWSLTGAFTYAELRDSDVPGAADEEWMIWLLQSGYRFPNSGWEIAARWSAYLRTVRGAAAGGADAEPETNTLAVAIICCLDGHRNKVTFDATYVGANRSDPFGGGFADVYSGVPLGWTSDGGSLLARLQWQLAL